MKHLKLSLLGLGMIAFGIIYAIKIAIRPFDTGETWKSVVIGDGMTDVGSGMLLWVLLEQYISNWKTRLGLCLIPLFSHALTGGPMITGQVLKNYYEVQELKKARRSSKEYAISQ